MADATADLNALLNDVSINPDPVVDQVDETINYFNSACNYLLDGAEDVLEKLHCCKAKRGCDGTCLHQIKTSPAKIQKALSMLATMSKDVIAKLSYFEKNILPQIDAYLRENPHLVCFQNVYMRIRSDVLFLTKYTACWDRADFLLLAELASGYKLNNKVYATMVNKFYRAWLNPTIKTSVVDVMNEMQQVIYNRSIIQPPKQSFQVYGEQTPPAFHRCVKKEHMAHCFVNV